MTAQKSSCSPGPNNYPVPGPGTKHHPAPSAIVFICHTAILRGTGGLSTADAANTRFVSSCSDYDMTAHVSCSQFMPLRFHRSFLRHSPLSAAQQRCHVSRVTEMISNVTTHLWTCSCWQQCCAAARRKNPPQIESFKTLASCNRAAHCSVTALCWRHGVMTNKTCGNISNSFLWLPIYGRGGAS